MKKVQIISICILIVTLVVMVVNKIVIPLSDWVIRMDGVIMLVSLFVVSFSTVKYVLYQFSQRGNEPESVTVHHGTFQHHYDAELLRARYIRFRKGRNGTSCRIAGTRFYYFVYYL